METENVNNIQDIINLKYNDTDLSLIKDEDIIIDDKVILSLIKERKSSITIEDFRDRAKRRWREHRVIGRSLLSILTYSEIVKDDVKNGKICLESKQLLEELYKILSSSNIANFFHHELPSAFYQTMALLSEQFYRWGDIEKAKSCVRNEPEKLNGNYILTAIKQFNIIIQQNYSSKTSLSSENLNLKIPLPLDSNPKVIKEQIRFCLAYIQTSTYGESKYEETLFDLTNLEKFVENMNRNQPPWNGTLAIIYSYLGRCHRNRVDYFQAVVSFGKAISCYENRLDQLKEKIQKLKEQLEEVDKEDYQLEAYYIESERKFVRNRMALIIIIGYGWMDIQRGQILKGLFNSLYPAKALLSDIDDVLAKNYLILLEVAAMRWLSLPKYVRRETTLRNSLFDSDKVLEKSKEVMQECSKLQLPKFTLRALYELVLCLEYCESWSDAETKVRELTNLAENQEDKFWTVKSYLLKARILNKRKYYERRSISKDEITEDFNKVFDDSKKFNQTRLEYYLTRGEVDLTWEDLDAAVGNFNEAIKLNRRKKANDPLNPKIEANCLLRLAQIDIKRGYANEAEKKLIIWETSLADIINDVYLQYLAERNKINLASIMEGELVIKVKDIKDLNYSKQDTKLRQFLVKQANRLTENERSSMGKISKYLGISRKTLDNWRRDFSKRPISSFKPLITEKTED